MGEHCGIGGAVGSVGWKCGSSADGAINFERDWTVPQISCCWIGVQDRLLLVMPFVYFRTFYCTINAILEVVDRIHLLRIVPAIMEEKCVHRFHRKDIVL